MRRGDEVLSIIAASRKSRCRYCQSYAWSLSQTQLPTKAIGAPWILRRSKLCGDRSRFAKSRGSSAEENSACAPIAPLRHAGDGWRVSCDCSIWECSAPSPLLRLSLGSSAVENLQNMTSVVANSNSCRLFQRQPPTRDFMVVSLHDVAPSNRDVANKIISELSPPRRAHLFCSRCSRLSSSRIGSQEIDNSFRWLREFRIGRS